MIKTQEIEYLDHNTTCRAFIAYDDQKAQLPAVLVAHDWGGRSQLYCDKAIALAKLGYLGFALDMYGEAKLGQNKTENLALLAPFREQREKVLPRITAALNCARGLANVDANKITAIGYCFGGACVLDLARFNAEVAGVVSFHGRLLAPENSPTNPLSSKVLVLHGFDDPLVPADQVLSFTDEMNARQADWQIHMYGNTQHAFTNPTAHDDEMGLHYDAKADRRSWQSACDFLTELFDT